MGRRGCTGRRGEKVQGMSSINGSMGNGEAKELICTTHGHELREDNGSRRWGAVQRGTKGRKMGQL